MVGGGGSSVEFRVVVDNVKESRARWLVYSVEIRVCVLTVLTMKETNCLTLYVLPCN
jgi:predicted DNA-binding ribbon-helix-helix protein